MKAAMLLLLALSLAAVDDPYASWSHGRPQDAAPVLRATAEQSDRWDAWLDAGLAAAAAGWRPHAIACLVEAHVRAPERTEPRDALTALNATPPAGWIVRLGPLALPGSGWLGFVLLVCAGLTLGHALVVPRRRAAITTIGALAFLVAAPGLIASAVDGSRRFAVPLRDTHLLDSAGNPGPTVAAGTLAERTVGKPWAGRVPVALPDGKHGWLALADLRDVPPRDVPPRDVPPRDVPPSTH